MWAEPKARREDTPRLLIVKFSVLYVEARLSLSALCLLLGALESATAILQSLSTHFQGNIYMFPH